MPITMSPASPAVLPLSQPLRRGGRTALVVDDSGLQRRLLAEMLTDWGYDVQEAETGEAALILSRQRQFDLVISDWMMPGMNGLEFCEALRALPGESYSYFILVTAKSEKDEVAHGLHCGADDFLTKPVTPGELRARIAAGERIIHMQRRLSDSNRRLNETLAEVRGLYSALDRDLDEARKLQQALVRDHSRDFGPAALSVLLRPSGQIGGDLAGFFPIGPRRVGFFSVDVAGHGVAAALMMARLSGLFSPGGGGQNVALVRNEYGTLTPRRPREVAVHLNRVFLEEMETERYFTMIYADADMVTGCVTFVQAGHPNPALIRAGGAVEFPGAGGFPIGLIAEAEYEETTVTLRPGDRMLLLTDGVMECGAAGEGVKEEQLAEILLLNRQRAGRKFLESVIADLAKAVGGTDFPDDISCTLSEFGRREDA